MAEFMGDFVVLLAMVVLAGGLWHWDMAKRDARGYPAKVAAWVLILAGFGTGLCASTYMLKFKSAGDFDRAYPPALLQVHDMDMMRKMMGGMGQMQNGNIPTPAPSSATGDHAAHH